MTLIAVDMAPAWTGLGFLAVIVAVAVAYQVHLRLLRQEVRRVQSERSLALASSQALTPGCAAQEPESVPTLAPVLQFSAAQRHWADRLTRDRAVTSQDRDARTVAHSAGA